TAARRELAALPWSFCAHFLDEFARDLLHGTHSFPADSREVGAPVVDPAGRSGDGQGVQHDRLGEPDIVQRLDGADETVGQEAVARPRRQEGAYVGVSSAQVALEDL